jgi:hypothetical protein
MLSFVGGSCNILTYDNDGILHKRAKSNTRSSSTQPTNNKIPANHEALTVGVQA